MKTRLRRLDHPRIHSQKPASRTVHTVSNVEIDEQSAYAGRSRHLLRVTDGGWFAVRAVLTGWLEYRAAFGSPGSGSD